MDITILQERIKALEEKNKENNDNALRLSSEFEGYKRRHALEMDRLRKFANESIIKAMLPIIDNLHRAIEHPNDVEGVKMIATEMRKVVEQS